VVKRIGSLLLLAGALVVLTTSAHLAVGPPAHAAGGATVIAAIDLPSLFGDENEPDENEPDENGPSHPGGRAAHRSRHRSIGGVPLTVALPIIGVVLALVAATALVVRWVRKYRAWKRHMAYRMRVGVRRLADDLERVRRRGLRP
jgi:hypothetical protein